MCVFLGGGGWVGVGGRCVLCAWPATRPRAQACVVPFGGYVGELVGAPNGQVATGVLFVDLLTGAHHWLATCWLPPPPRRSYDIALTREMGKEGRMYSSLAQYGGPLYEKIMQQNQLRQQGAAGRGAGELSCGGRGRRRAG